MIMFIYETLQSVFNFCLLFIVTYLYSIYHKIWFMIIFILNVLQKVKCQFFSFVCVCLFLKKIVKIYFLKLKFRLFTTKKKIYYYKANPKLTLSIYSHTSLYLINTHDSIMKMLWSITSQKKKKKQLLKKKKRRKKKTTTTNQDQFILDKRKIDTPASNQFPNQHIRI